MKKYVKEVEGKKIYKTRSQIVIEKNGMSTYNPTEEMILADGWEEYIYIAPEENIEDIKRDKKYEIEVYDQSNKVNIFYVNDTPVWLDKATRSGLMLRFQAELASGQKNTSLWYNGTQFPLILSQAVQMLYAIEIYASMCYDNTQFHLSNIDNLESIEEIEGYDYRVGYPEKLYF